MRTLLAASALLLAIPALAHPFHETGPSFATCAATAPAATACSTGPVPTQPTGVHHRGGIDAAFAHGPWPSPMPGYTGTVLSVVTWGATDTPWREPVRRANPALEDDVSLPQHRVWCHILDGVFDAALCFASGQPPPHPATFVHECYSLATGHDEIHERGGTGPWSCAVSHSTYPCGGNSVCALIPKV